MDIDEIALPGEQATDFTCRLAIEKATAGARSLPDEPAPIVLGADTAVVVDGEILGKPADVHEAVEMLGRLSGRTHEVITGVAGLRGERSSVRLSRTRVTFREIGDQERHDYAASDEPGDKAGAYAIQGRAAVFVERIDGSYSGVVGLPLFETQQILLDLDYPAAHARVAG